MSLLIPLASIALWIAASPLARGADEAAFGKLVGEAQQAQARNDFAGAASRYEQALKIDPGIAEVWANLGLMQYHAGEYSKAERSFKTALRLKPALFVPNLFLGLATLQQKRAAQAVPFLMRAHKLDPRDLETMLALGRVHSELHEPAMARVWFERVREMKPDSEDAWYGLGVSYLESAEKAAGLLAAAHRDSDYFLALQTEVQQRQQGRLTGPVADRNRDDVEHLFMVGDFTAASAAAHKLTSTDPRNPAGWYWVAKADQELAMSALLRVSELNPGSPRTNVLLGDAYRRRQMSKNAEEEYGKALALAPDNIAALFGLAATYYGDGHFEEAAPIARRALDRSAADAEINLLMAQILVGLRRPADAERYLYASLAAMPRKPARVHALLGKVYAVTNRATEAVAELKLGLASDDDGSVHYQLGRLYQQLGNQKSAAEAFAQARILQQKRSERAQAAMGLDPE